MFPCVSIAVEKIPVKLEAEGKTFLNNMSSTQPTKAVTWGQIWEFLCACTPKTRPWNLSSASRWLWSKRRKAKLCRSVVRELSLESLFLGWWTRLLTEKQCEHLPCLTQQNSFCPAEPCCGAVASLQSMLQSSWNCEQLGAVSVAARTHGYCWKVFNFYAERESEWNSFLWKSWCARLLYRQFSGSRLRAFHAKKPENQSPSDI